VALPGDAAEGGVLGKRAGLSQQHRVAGEAEDVADTLNARTRPHAILKAEGVLGNPSHTRARTPFNRDHGPRPGQPVPVAHAAEV
jgi:hypothetical protein